MLRIALTLAVLCAIGACSRPVEPSVSGAELFANHCSACHGALGEGDGPVAAVMQIGVPNLRNLSERNGGSFPADAARAYIDGRSLPVSHGDRYMPIWGNVFRWETGAEAEAESAVATRIDALVDYLETIQQ